MYATWSKCSLWTVLITVLSMTTGRAFPLALSSHMITRHSWWTGALLLTASSVSTWSAFFLACVALVTRFTDTGAMATVTLQSVLLDTLTLLRAACTKCPLWTREVAEASVESRITQTGSVGPVTAPVISTVTLLVALLPVEALRTAILAQVSTDPGRTAAAPSDGITAGTIFTLTGEGAVFTKMSLGARLVADDADPPVRAVAASFPRVAFSFIRAVVTRQTAVVTKRVVQTHKFLSQVAFCPQLPLIVLIVVIALQGLVVVLHQGELWANQRQLDGTSAGQGLNCIF